MKLKTKIDLSYKDNHSMYHLILRKNHSLVKTMIIKTFRRSLYFLKNELGY